MRPTLTAGLLASALSVAWLTRLPVDGSYFWDLFPAFVLGGAGMGLSFVPVTIASLTGVAPADAGVASGLVNTSRQIGGAVGIAAVSAIAATSTSTFADAHGVASTSGLALDHGFQTGLYALTGLLLLGAVIAVTLVRSAPPPARAREEDAGPARPGRLASADPPLDGIRVLDLSRVLAGPYCTMLLADLGADVIKVERPGEGDETARGARPSRGASRRTSWPSTAASARSRSTWRGRRRRRRCGDSPRRADVVIENFRAGTAERLGAGYERLARENPKLVYCSISGFGDEPARLRLHPPGRERADGDHRRDGRRAVEGRRRGRRRAGRLRGRDCDPRRAGRAAAAGGSRSRSTTWRSRRS